MDNALLDVVLTRLDVKPLAEEAASLLLAAFEGEAALLAQLSGDAGLTAEHGPDGPAVEPAGAYLRSVSVSGFRGVGPTATYGPRSAKRATTTPTNSPPPPVSSPDGSTPWPGSWNRCKPKGRDHEIVAGLAGARQPAAARAAGIHDRDRDSAGSQSQARLRVSLQVSRSGVYAAGFTSPTC